MTVGRLARAAAIVAVFGLVSRLLGFVREIVLAARLRRLGPADAFVNSLLIVNSVAAILLYTLVTLIIPMFQRERADDGDRTAPGGSSSALAVWVGVLLVVLSAIVRDLAARRPPPSSTSTRRARPRPRRADPDHGAGPRPPGLLGASSPRCSRSTAASRGRRRWAWRSTLGIIVGVVVGQSHIGIEAAAWGVVLGATLQVLLQLPQFWRLLREARARPALTHPRLGAVGAAGAAGAGRVGPPAGQQLHRQALRLERSRPAGSRP